jgi:hypothetical protein
MSLRINRPDSADWYIKLHRQQLKPPFPIMVFCPNCGHGLIEVNALGIEISNDIGLPPTQLTPSDAWTRYKHKCKAFIVIYYK